MSLLKLFSKRRFFLILFFLLITITQCSYSRFSIKKNNLQKKNIYLSSLLFLKESNILFLEIENKKINNIENNSRQKLVDKNFIIFNQNQFIGGIFFSGGIIIDKQNEMITRAKNIHFKMQEEFTGHLKVFFYNQLKQLLNNKIKNNLYHISQQTIEKLKQIKLLTPILDHSFYKKIRSDNINIPVYKYLPQKQYSSIVKLFKQKKTGLLLIPIIKYYYAHNGGWFNDQTYGCGAGARISFQLLGIDIKTGKLVFNFDSTKKKLYEYKFQLSKAEMKYELSILEKKMLKELDYFLK